MPDIFTRHQVELAQGPVSYREAGEGEPIVFIHGLLVDGRLWDGVARRLADSHRCIVPDWPMGSHRLPLNEGADLSPPGMAALVDSFFDSAGLEGATVVGNDSGGAISQILATRHPERVNRLVLTNCDLYDKFPPFPFSLMPPIVRIPGGMAVLAAPFRIGFLGRATYGLLAQKPIDPALADDWLAPMMGDAGVKRDTRKFTAGAHKRHTLEAAERLRSFERPALLAWGEDDRFFKMALAERLVAAMPDARLERIPGAGTFVPLDQPERVAELISGFIAETGESRPRVSSATRN